MKGIELAKAYYENFGADMLSSGFEDQLPYLAAGLFGSGSECLGYDDEVSADHDLEPGFCLMLPDEDVIDRRNAFLLERAYASLPNEFCGFRRSALSPVGGSRHGVIRIADFFMEKTGTPNGNLSVEQWMSIPEYNLAEAVNGMVFFDNYGLLTEIRKCLEYYPENIRLKKLAGHLLLMAQSGQYNYIRCIRHGEPGAAQLAVFEFARSTMQVIFLLNRRYMPYYKWSFRALRELPVLSLTAELLEYLMTTDNDPSMSEEKYRVIEGIAADVIDELMDQGLTRATCGDLEKHAYSVNDSISEGSIRNMHILAGC